MQAAKVWLHDTNASERLEYIFSKTQQPLKIPKVLPSDVIFGGQGEGYCKASQWPNFWRAQSTSLSSMCSSYISDWIGCDQRCHQLGTRTGELTESVHRPDKSCASWNSNSLQPFPSRILHWETVWMVIFHSLKRCDTWPPHTCYQIGLINSIRSCQHWFISKRVNPLWRRTLYIYHDLSFRVQTSPSSTFQCNIPLWRSMEHTNIPMLGINYF